MMPSQSSYQPTFDSVCLQGSICKEDYSDLCSFLIDKTVTISFLSCLADFKKIAFQENLDKLRAIQIRGDSEIYHIANLLDKTWGLKRLEYIGVSIFDQLLKFNYKQKLPQLGRVCISSYYFDSDIFERFLIETLPALDYLELSSVELSDEMMLKCSEKFKQLVVFGHPELAQNRRQQL